MPAGKSIVAVKQGQIYRIHWIRRTGALTAWRHGAVAMSEAFIFYEINGANGELKV